MARFVKPLLNGGKGAERDDDDARVEADKLFVVVTQLCHMRPAGYSAKVAQKDEKQWPVGMEIRQGARGAFDGVEGKGGGGVSGLGGGLWHVFGG